MRTSFRYAEWALIALITLGAGALRLAHLGQVASDPFYDGAVRSMTLSWHNFFFGAVEPSGAVAIDKPPVDLWLQVASVELFGFRSAALKLPEALAGTLAVPLLFAAVRSVFGVRAGLAAALALAVLPVEVITARSDTMDAVMMALTVLALLLVARATKTGSTLWLLAAAAALGLAFDVKLLESLLALPGLALFAYLGLPGSRRRRVAQLTLGGLLYVAVALAWLTATLIFPAHDRPYAYGSTNGSAWNAAFVFNGLDRIQNKAVEGPQQGFLPNHRYPERTQAERDAIPIVPPAPTRLLARIGPLSGERLGLEMLAGLLLGAAALGAMVRERRAASPRAPGAGPTDRRSVAAAAGLLLWLATGIVLFSHMARLHPRYTEGFTPAVAATLGFGIAWATDRRTTGRLLALTVTLLAVSIYSERLLFGTSTVWWILAAGAATALALAWTVRPHSAPRGAESTSQAGERATHGAQSALRGGGPTSSNGGPAYSGGVLALGLVCLLAIPLWASLRAVRENASDTTPLGSLRADELGPLSVYLRAHQGDAYYEAAFDSGTKMGGLVVRDARPILVLTTLNGEVLTPVARLRALAAGGRVRYAFLDTLCGPHSPPTDADCSAPARWVQAHGTDVSRQAGMPRTGMLWRLP
jgi:4-amino-4-deoxy-L-arabinose transferase-like glycosyltransferase